MFPNLWENRSIQRVIHREPVYTRIPVRVKFRLGLNQTVKLFCYLPITHYHYPNAANTGGIMIGGLSKSMAAKEFINAKLMENYTLTLIVVKKIIPHTTSLSKSLSFSPVWRGFSISAFFIIKCKRLKIFASLMPLSKSRKSRLRFG